MLVSVNAVNQSQEVLRCRFTVLTIDVLWVSLGSKLDIENIKDIKAQIQKGGLNHE